MLVVVIAQEKGSSSGEDSVRIRPLLNYSLFDKILPRLYRDLRFRCLSSHSITTSVLATALGTPIRTAISVSISVSGIGPPLRSRPPYTKSVSLAQSTSILFVERNKNIRNVPMCYTSYSILVHVDVKTFCIWQQARCRNVQRAAVLVYFRRCLADQK